MSDANHSIKSLKPRLSVGRRIALLVFVIVCAVVTLSGCSPFYVMRAAYEESKILLAREQIEKVIANPKTADDEREKLSIVVAARAYASSLGLNPGQSFTKYSRVHSDVLSWVLAASKPDAFELYQWWFPIVGSVPYKGYFEKEDAIAEGRRLRDKGYEIWIRGTEAFSTLGWFNDPILSTTLKQPITRIANTVLHESTHSTVWIPNSVAFNESLANFVGTQAAVNFFELRLESCASEPTDKPVCTLKRTADLENAKLVLSQEMSLAKYVQDLYRQLNTLYTSTASKEEKLKRREEIFSQALSPLRPLIPDMKILQKLNNAEIVQLIIYLTRLELFDTLFQKTNHDWTLFIKAIRNIQEKTKSDPTLDPFTLLEGAV